MSTESDQGLEALKRGDANAAIPLLEQAIQNDANDFNAHLYLGAAYAQANRANDAVTILTQSVHLQPSNAQARFNLGIALQKAGWANEAATAFEQALMLQPEYPQAQQALNALRPPQDASQAQVPTQVISPQQAPSYQPPQYTPINPQQGLGSPSPYAPPQQGYAQAPQPAAYNAHQSPYPYPSMDVDMEKNRKGLLMYGYGGYAYIAIIIVSIVWMFSSVMGAISSGKPEAMMSAIGSMRLLNLFAWVALATMAVGMVLVWRATKVKTIAFVALAMSAWTLLSTFGLLFSSQQPNPLAQSPGFTTTTGRNNPFGASSGVSPRQRNRNAGLISPTGQPMSGASSQDLTPEQMAVMGGAAAGVVAGVVIFGIVAVCLYFGALYCICAGFRQIAVGVNNQLAESQAQGAVNTFKISGYLLLGGLLVAFLGLVSRAGIFAGLGFVAYLIGGIGFLVCWVRTLMTAVTLANS